MKALRNRALQEGILLLALSGALIGYAIDGQAHSFSHDWNQSPYLSPVIIGGLLAVLALLTLISAILQLTRKSQEQEQTAGEKQSNRTGLLRVLGLLVLSGVYYAGLALIRLPYWALRLGSITLRFSTFELTTVFFVAVLMAYMGVRKARLLTLVPLGATLFLSVVFRSLLHVLLP